MRILRVVLLIALGVMSIGVMPVAAQEQAREITCEGDLLVVLTVDYAEDGFMYRVNGISGPGLPTSPKGPGVHSEMMVFTWTLPGPGTWIGLYGETDGGSGGDAWTSDFGWEVYAVCVEAAPGCTEFIPLPDDAVVGHFNWNSEIYWEPGHMAVPPIIIDAGKTYYVVGQDVSETYYKVLIACSWAWVRKDTVGPNYDEVWNGAPLPTTIVE